MANGSDSIYRDGDSSYLFRKTKEQWLAEGSEHEQVQRYEEALEAYTNVLLLDPSLAEAYNLQGLVLLKLRRSEQAFDAFSKARDLFEFRLHQHPVDAVSYTGKGLALHGLGRQREALTTFEYALELYPRHAEAHHGIGLVLAAIGHDKEALDAFERAILSAPTRADYFAKKGTVLLRLKRYAEALGAAERAIQLAPSSAQAYGIKGHALRKLKCYGDALGIYERLLALNPNVELAWLHKSEMLRHLGRSKEAQQAHATFLRLVQRKGMGW